MPGSPQATPGEAESRSPQEVLKPPHILEIPAGQQRRRRERVSGLSGGLRRPAGAPASSPQKGRGSGSRRRSSREHGQGTAQQGLKAGTRVLVAEGSCTPGHHQDRPSASEQVRRPLPNLTLHLLLQWGSCCAGKRLPQSRAGLGSQPRLPAPDPSACRGWGRGCPGGPTTASTHTTPHTRQMDGLHGLVRHATGMRWCVRGVGGAG